MEEKLRNIVSLMANLEEEKLLDEVKQQLQENIDPMNILDACREGIRIVGEKFAQEEYYISDLIMSAEILKGAMKILEPLLTSGTGEASGKVVFGTVKGDIHNIGKDIVISLLRADGFEVFDLGVDTPPEAFIEKLKETGAKILGLSGLIPISYDSMKETVEALEKVGLRDRVKVIVGGGLVDEQVCAYAGADGWGDNATTAVDMCREFIKEA